MGLPASLSYSRTLGEQSTGSEGPAMGRRIPGHFNYFCAVSPLERSLTFTDDKAKMTWSHGTNETRYRVVSIQPSPKGVVPGAGDKASPVPPCTPS